MEQFFKIAEVLKPQGIKGELKLKPFMEDTRRFLKLSTVYRRQGGEYIAYEASENRLYKGFCYIKLSGCDDRNAAELLRGEALYIKREDAAPLKKGEVYIADILGAEVFDDTGAYLGILREVRPAGGVDIYSVSGERSLMFPAAPGVILVRSAEEKRIVVSQVRLMEVCVFD